MAIAIAPQEVGLEEKNLRPREARQRAAETFLEIEDFGQAGHGRRWLGELTLW